MYIGREPQVGNFQVCDAISVVNGQAAYTMQVSSVNVSPETANHVLCSVNGILQQSGSSFTVSGSTITFASNLATGDVIDFIQILGNVLDLGVPSDATVTNAKTNFVSTSSAAGLQIKGDGTTDGTLQLNCSQNSHGIKLKSPPHSASASYTLTFPNDDGSSGEALTTNGSGVLTWASAGANNSPNFHVYDANQTLNNTTWTKFTVATERFDNGSAYDTSTSRFTVPSGEGGVYLFNGMYRMENDSGSSFLKFYKNGSALNDFVSEFHGSSYFAVNCTIMVNLSASDYIEMYGYINVGNTNGIADINFQGFKIG